MEFKRYQERAIKEVGDYLQKLVQHKDERYPAQAAWDDLEIPVSYKPRRNGAGKDLPTFCIKVPTGGGKTLLATQVLGLIYRTILKERNGAGLVLWVVPSDQIYKDTLRRLRDRNDFYRVSLEASLSRRIEIWEKQEVARLTPGQLALNLNILIIKLQGTNRQDKESLKFFRDSGGNIVAHFPPEDEPDKHRALKEKIPNLDMVEDNPTAGRFLAKSSIGNLVRMCEPAVVLDEGHKWTSPLARKTVEGFNPRIVVELSATPPKDEANVLVRVTGNELLDEEMIKLPMNIAGSNQRHWKDVVTVARDRKEQLAAKAIEHYEATGVIIRPIVLVQVERTGKEQRGAGYIHSEDVKEYLIERVGVKEDAIAIKTSEKDDLEGRADLLDEDCPIEWIITKAALQEGWDCPFAYILVALSESSSARGMTQLVGRVLRQPYQKKTPFTDLNESYIYCQKRSAQEIAREVKRALEEEGYEGAAASTVDLSSGQRPVEVQKAKIRKGFLIHYKQPFEGKIFLPRFCVKTSRTYEALDYYRHLLSEVDVTSFPYSQIDWDFTEDLTKAKDRYWRITLGTGLEELESHEIGNYQDDASVKAWIVSTLDFYWFSAKQLHYVVEMVCERLLSIKDKIALVKFLLREKIEGFIQRHTDDMTKAVFENLYSNKRLCFYLECVEGRFEIPSEVEIRLKNARKLRNPDTDEPVQKNLFDFVANDLNEYEKRVALYIDQHPQVLWWYRNLVGEGNFAIQGHRRSPIYPDFVVQKGNAEGNHVEAKVLVVESKGAHLKGNEDTTYKRYLGKIFQELGQQVSWQELGEGFESQKFRFQVLDEGEYADRDWHADLKVFLET
jgi:type III restriction enzyme